MDDDIKLIVSLTSYPARFTRPEFLQVLHSLTEQKTDVKYKVVLTIYSQDIPKIPSIVNEFIEAKNIELLSAPLDLSAHKKYFYVMQKYRDLPIVTADDDFIYSDTLVQRLYEEHLKYPGIIIASAAQPIKFDENGNTLPYTEWRVNFVTDPTPSLDILPTNGAGSLFPPEFNRVIEPGMVDEIFDMCLLARDDFYLHYVAAYRNSIPAKVVDKDAFIGWVPSHQKNLDPPFGTLIHSMCNNSTALWRTNECAMLGGADGNQMSCWLFNKSNRKSK